MLKKSLLTKMAVGAGKKAAVSLAKGTVNLVSGPIDKWIEKERKERRRNFLGYVEAEAAKNPSMTYVGIHETKEEIKSKKGKSTKYKYLFFEKSGARCFAAIEDYVKKLESVRIYDNNKRMIGSITQSPPQVGENAEDLPDYECAVSVRDRSCFIKKNSDPDHACFTPFFGWDIVKIQNGYAIEDSSGNTIAELIMNSPLRYTDYYLIQAQTGQDIYVVLTLLMAVVAYDKYMRRPKN